MAILTNAVGNYTAFALSRAAGNLPTETTSTKKTEDVEPLAGMSGYVAIPGKEPEVEDYFHSYTSDGGMTGMALGVNVNWRG